MVIPQGFGLQLGMGLDLIDDELEAEPFELRQENRQYRHSEYLVTRKTNCKG